jgi:hypothetical protein
VGARERGAWERGNGRIGCLRHTPGDKSGDVTVLIARERFPLALSHAPTLPR